VVFDQPIVRIRETVDIVRRLLSGENVNFNGKAFKLRDSRLGFTPVRAKVPIYLAALGPKMIQLAGEIADGVLLNWASPAYIKMVTPHLQHGADQAGRKLEDIDVACYLSTAVVNDVEKALPEARRYIARYCATPVYKKYFGEMGFAKEATAASEALAFGDGKGAVAAISDAMVDDLVIIGSAEHCRRNVAAVKAHGPDMPIIAPFRVGDDAMESFHTTVAAFSG
jgi:alkanesulfonate monooxygenase SsuD/methylene tetrahydromethanopterin reductase-like flavin-dependent oxidoreductase (luciferase family)